MPTPDTINRETMALLASSFAGAAVRALSTRSTTRVDRSKGLVCRAEDKMARTTIDLDKRKIGPGTGKPIKVTFLGANGQNVVVDCPEDQYILDAGIDAGLHERIDPRVAVIVGALFPLLRRQGQEAQQRSGRQQVRLRICHAGRARWSAAVFASEASRESSASASGVLRSSSSACWTPLSPASPAPASHTRRRAP